MSEDAPVEVFEGPIDLEEANTPAPVLPTGNTLPVIDQPTGPLSADESGVLEYYERIIETGVKTFVEVGHALTVIRDQRLYREHYATFDAYVRKRWDLERTYAHRIIEASEVVWQHGARERSSGTSTGESPPRAASRGVARSGADRATIGDHREACAGDGQAGEGDGNHANPDTHLEGAEAL